MASRMRLPHDETRSEHLYSMPDPDGLLETYDAARRAFYTERRHLTGEQITVLLTLAGGYLDLTMYELGQECCVGKLRDIWRARRARRESP